MPELTVFHLVPDDVLLIGNVGAVQSAGDATALQQTLAELREQLPSVQKVVAFVGDIDVTTLREVGSDA